MKSSKTALSVALLALGVALVSACGSSLPPAKAADTQASISAAAAVGAEQNPQGALHLKLARDQLQEAQRLIDAGKNKEARLVLERADSDAELALMITREADATASLNKTRADVEALQNGGRH
jgi:hypothetical protein